MNYNIEEIKEQFKKVIVYSQNCKEEINVDNLFAQWQENKGSFIHKFGEKLIYEINNTIKPDFVINLGDSIEDFNDKEISVTDKMGFSVIFYPF